MVKIRFTDGIGISVSIRIVISLDIKIRYAKYRFINPYEEFRSVENMAVTVNEGGNGVLATTGL